MKAPALLPNRFCCAMPCQEGTHAQVRALCVGLWYMDKCWLNNFGLTNKELES